MEIKNFRDLKKLVEKNTKCELEYVSPTRFKVLEPFYNELDGEGWSCYDIEHDGTIDGMVEAIIDKYEGYNIWGDTDYYGDVVELLSGLTIEE